MISTVTLKVIGMHCTSCAMNIDGELEDLGVKDVNTNYANQESKIEFDDDKLSLKNIQEAIKKLGYQSTIIE